MATVVAKRVGQSLNSELYYSIMAIGFLLSALVHIPLLFSGAQRKAK
jgi:hypothetical protein